MKKLLSIILLSITVNITAQEIKSFPVFTFSAAEDFVIHIFNEVYKDRFFDKELTEPGLRLWLARNDFIINQMGANNTLSWLSETIERNDRVIVYHYIIFKSGSFFKEWYGIAIRKKEEILL